ncbi:MAG: hypothetical protein K2Z76_11235 [Mycobacterium gordonae]|nr:hypothetical protein [Mycobacterium gordonae]
MEIDSAIEVFSPRGDLAATRRRHARQRPALRAIAVTFHALAAYYAIGDCFAERAARTVAANITGQLHGHPQPESTSAKPPATSNSETGWWQVDIDFRSSPQPVATFTAPSPEFATNTTELGSTRRARRFSR